MAAPADDRGGASRAISRSSQIKSEPRLRRAVLQADQFVVRRRAGEGLLIRPAQPHGFMLRIPEGRSLAKRTCEPQLATRKPQLPVVLSASFDVREWT